MKLLVLTLCVCAASAATVRTVLKPWEVTAQATAQVVPAQDPVPVVPVAKSRSFSGNDVDAVVLRSNSEVLPDGFNYQYETENGISAAASGVLKKGESVDFVAVKGSFSYVAPDGTPILVTYVADENGFQPQSESLPVGPGVPEAIQRSLDYLKSQPRFEETNVPASVFPVKKV